jgi:eukaryotic-like serine/threonine-protein kinase
MWPWTDKHTPKSYHTTLDPVYASNECNRFLVLVLASGLTSYSELQDACRDFDTDRTDKKALDDLASQLVKREALTQWQCDKLRAGKWKGFYMDNYKLIGPVEPCDQANNKYMAEDISTHKAVTLRVKYNETAPRIEYSVLTANS